MNTKLFCAMALLIPQAAFAASLAGTLVEGGGSDDMHIVVKGAGGKKVYAYCLQRCGDLFYADKHEQYFLKKTLVGKKVVLTHQDEKNNDRIAGAGEDGPLTFVKKQEFVR